MRFTVAIHAEEHALGELGTDTRPPLRNSVDRQAELLVFRSDVMKLERVDRAGEAAAPASTSGFDHRSQLHVLPEAHDLMPAVGLGSCVPNPVAIHADEDAFLGFGVGSFDASEKSAQGERLRRGI